MIIRTKGKPSIYEGFLFDEACIISLYQKLHVFETYFLLFKTFVLSLRRKSRTPMNDSQIKHIKSLMESLGLTKSALAEKCDVSTMTIHRILSDET